MEESGAESYEHQAPEKCALPWANRRAAWRVGRRMGPMEFIVYSRPCTKQAADRRAGYWVKHYGRVLGALWSHPGSER